MEKDDLKLIWKEIHTEGSMTDEGELKQIMNMKHCKRISQILSDKKREMCAYLFVFVLFIALMFYAFIYLNINLSFISVFIFSFAGIFLFFKTTHSVSTFVVLSKETDNMSLKDSVKNFASILNRIQKIDFITNLFFFYGLAILMTFIFSKDIDGISKSELTVLIICLIPFMLIIPWFIKRLHSKRYNKFYMNLKKSRHDIEDAQ